MSEKSYFAEGEEEENKLLRKAKESPFLVAGMTGFVIAGLIGAYKFKHRGDMRPSVFLMQLRVAAQGTAVGCLTLGLAYNMLKEYVLDKPGEDKK